MKPLLALITALPLSAAAAPATLEAPPPCRTSAITFGTGTLERIVREPEVILQHEETFWQSEIPQRYTREWAATNNFPISYDAWREAMRSLAALDARARDTTAIVRMTAHIVSQRAAFLSKAVPFICGFLPDAVDLDVGVYFTAFIPPRSFLRNGIVINVAATYWKGNAANILNNLVHEIFHVGYAKRRELRTEPPLADRRTYDMLDAVHNEGTATYVGSLAVADFPAPDDRDYPMLNAREEVARLLSELNGLIAQVGRIPDDELDKLAWDRGVMNRAYYIVGAHMARTIDVRRGRPALIRTIEEGPVAFAMLYNSLVPEAEQLHVGSRLFRRHSE